MNLANIHNLQKEKGRRGLRSYVVRKKPGNRKAEWAKFGRLFMYGSRPFIEKPRLLKSCFCHVDGSFNIPLSLWRRPVQCTVGFVLMRSRHFFLLIFLVSTQNVC